MDASAFFLAILTMAIGFIVLAQDLVLVLGIKMLKFKQADWAKNKKVEPCLSRLLPR